MGTATRAGFGLAVTLLLCNLQTEEAKAVTVETTGYKTTVTFSVKTNVAQGEPQKVGWRYETGQCNCLNCDPGPPIVKKTSVKRAWELSASVTTGLEASAAIEGLCSIKGSVTVEIGGKYTRETTDEVTKSWFVAPKHYTAAWLCAMKQKYASSGTFLHEVYNKKTKKTMRYATTINYLPYHETAEVAVPFLQTCPNNDPKHHKNDKSLEQPPA